jgi:heme exporter protein A
VTLLLELDRLALIRGGRLLFEGVSLRLEAGGAALIRGPNGVGKSSLMRVVAGLLRASAGRVERHCSASLADENGALDERLPLGRALGFWASLDRGSAPIGMAALDLDRLADVPVRMLSTGQRKRATLARVVSSGASLWLLDEPANGLDTDGQERLATAMATHRDRGGAVLAATHQPLGLENAQELVLGAA